MHIKLFCRDVRLFCRDIRLFCRDVRLDCTDVRLFCRDIELFRREIGLICTEKPLFCSLRDKRGANGIAVVVARQMANVKKAEPFLTPIESEIGPSSADQVSIVKEPYKQRPLLPQIFNDFEMLNDSRTH